MDTIETQQPQSQPEVKAPPTQPSVKPSDRPKVDIELFRAIIVKE